MKELKRNYDAIWEELRKQPFALPIPTSGRIAADMPDPAERQRVFDAVWETGGFRFIFESFDDLIINQEHQRRGLRVRPQQDPDDRQGPRDRRAAVPDRPSRSAPNACRSGTSTTRPSTATTSTWSASQDNPIERITPNGVRLADGSEHEVDVIVFALGFNAITGALAEVDIRGRGGREAEREVGRTERPPTSAWRSTSSRTCS